MSIGAILVSVAVVAVVAAYVARPFRRVAVDVDGIVEVWVRRARRAGLAMIGDEPEISASPQVVAVDQAAVAPAQPLPADDDEEVSFCPHCGRRVEPDHRFCPRCGKQLPRGETR